MHRTLAPELRVRSSGALRRELSARNLARCGAYPHDVSSAATPAVLYAASQTGEHGNFYPPAYRRILLNAAWRERLSKTYTGSARVPYPLARTRGELDAATSSDALLMSIFCAAGTLARPQVQALLGHGADCRLNFGHRTRVPLAGGLDDRTEVDLAIEDRDSMLFVEAKLTETGFQTARRALLERYPALHSTLDTDSLPRNGRGEYQGYQLIRSVLAAHHHQARFAVLADARRPDLHEQVFRVFASVRSADLRSRLHLYTWQELAATLSKPLQRFLAEKYGLGDHQWAVASA